MEHRDNSYLPITKENGEDENIHFINESPSMSLCQLAIALTRKYQAESKETPSQISAPLSPQHPSFIKKENYEMDELIIKSEFSEPENEATSVNDELQNMSKLVIKKEITAALDLNSQLDGTQIKTETPMPPPMWNFGENKDTSLPYQQTVNPAVPVKEKKRPMTAAERARNMRARKRLLKVKKRPMTSSERVKKWRELKKAAKKAVPFEALAINFGTSNFTNPDPAYFAQQSLSLNHEGYKEIHNFGHTFLNPFNER